MKTVARAITAVALIAFAVPALPCGFEKSQTTTMTTPSPASTAPIAKADKAKPVKAPRAKGSTAQKPTTTAAN